MLEFFSGPTLFLNFDGRISLNDFSFVVDDTHDLLFNMFPFFIAFGRIFANPEFLLYLFSRSCGITRRVSVFVSCRDRSVCV